MIAIHNKKKYQHTRVLQEDVALGVDRLCRTKIPDVSQGNPLSQLPIWPLPSLRCVLQQIHWILSKQKISCQMNAVTTHKLQPCLHALGRYKNYMQNLWWGGWFSAAFNSLHYGNQCLTYIKTYKSRFLFLFLFIFVFFNVIMKWNALVLCDL